MALPLTTRARAKVNLDLRVLGRRADGYHELESLVAFAGVGDTLSLDPGADLSLTLAGPRSEGLTADDGKLVAMVVKAGDQVLFNKYAGTEIKLDGVEHLVMREDDILAIIQ